MAQTQKSRGGPGDRSTDQNTERSLTMYEKYLQIAADRAATRPEVAAAHALVAIAMLLEMQQPTQRFVLGD